MKQTALLASSICIGQAQRGVGREERKTYGCQEELRIPLLRGRPALVPGGYTFVRLLNKTLSWNPAVTLVHHFKYLLQLDRTKEITHSPDISHCGPRNSHFSPRIFFCFIFTGFSFSLSFSYHHFTPLFLF